MPKSADGMQRMQPKNTTLDYTRPTYIPIPASSTILEPYHLKCYHEMKWKIIIMFDGQAAINALEFIYNQF